MNEEVKKEERTVAVIQKQYTETCAKAGHLQYQLFTLNKDLELINNLLRDLNIEAATVAAKEKPAEVSNDSSSNSA